MKRSTIKLPDFFDRYITLVDDIEVIAALESSYLTISSLNIKPYEKLGDKTYASGKWTIKDIIQHLIDNERIMCYRALRFARNDGTILPGYDENAFASNALANSRNITDLLEELKIVRLGSIHLFKSFSEPMIIQEGICFNKTISVAALGFVIAGHQIHHLNIIKERYLPLIEA